MWTLQRNKDFNGSGFGLERSISKSYINMHQVPVQVYMPANPMILKLGLVHHWMGLNYTQILIIILSFMDLNLTQILIILSFPILNWWIESRAINKYLAEKYKEVGPDLLRSNSLSESAIVGLWLEVEAQQFSPPISALVFESLIKPLLGGTTDNQAVENNAEKLGKVLDVYEERLSKSKYLAGDFYSLADLHHLPYTFCLMMTPKASLITSRPHVLAWWEDISSRPAWKKTAEGVKFGWMWKAFYLKNKVWAVWFLFCLDYVT